MRRDRTACLAPAHAGRLSPHASDSAGWSVTPRVDDDLADRSPVTHEPERSGDVVEVERGADVGRDSCRLVQLLELLAVAGEELGAFTPKVRAS